MFTLDTRRRMCAYQAIKIFCKNFAYIQVVILYKTRSNTRQYSKEKARVIVVFRIGPPYIFNFRQSQQQYSRIYKTLLKVEYKELFT